MFYGITIELYDMNGQTTCYILDRVLCCQNFSTSNLVLQISNVAEDTQPSLCILIKNVLSPLIDPEIGRILWSYSRNTVRTATVHSTLPPQLHCSSKAKPVI
jgi:hypothetical protein